MKCHITYRERPSHNTSLRCETLAGGYYECKKIVFFFKDQLNKCTEEKATEAIKCKDKTFNKYLNISIYVSFRSTVETSALTL